MSIKRFYKNNTFMTYISLAVAVFFLSVFLIKNNSNNNLNVGNCVKILGSRKMISKILEVSPRGGIEVLITVKYDNGKSFQFIDAYNLDDQQLLVKVTCEDE